MRTGYGILLGLVASVAVFAAPAPYPITINSRTAKAPNVLAFANNQNVYRATFKDGSDYSNISNTVPFMTWATNDTAAGYASASYNVVSAVSGIVDFTFAPSNVNYTGGTYIYEIGVKTDGVPGVYRQGAFQLQASPIGTGVPLDLIRSIDWSLYEYSNTSNAGPYRVGTGIAFATNTDGSVTVSTSYTETDPLSLHINGDNAMTADLDLGGYSLTNVGTNSISFVDGNSISIDTNGFAFSTGAVFVGDVLLDDNNQESPLLTFRNGENDAAVLQMSNTVGFCLDTTGDEDIRLNPGGGEIYANDANVVMSDGKTIGFEAIDSAVRVEFNDEDNDNVTVHDGQLRLAVATSNDKGLSIRNTDAETECRMYIDGETDRADAVITIDSDHPKAELRIEGTSLDTIRIGANGSEIPAIVFYDGSPSGNRKIVLNADDGSAYLSGVQLDYHDVSARSANMVAYQSAGSSTVSAPSFLSSSSDRAIGGAVKGVNTSGESGWSKAGVVGVSDYRNFASYCIGVMGLTREGNYGQRLSRGIGGYFRSELMGQSTASGSKQWGVVSDVYSVDTNSALLCAFRGKVQGDSADEAVGFAIEVSGGDESYSLLVCNELRLEASAFDLYNDDSASDFNLSCNGGAMMIGETDDGNKTADTLDFRTSGSSALSIASDQKAEFGAAVTINCDTDYDANDGLMIVNDVDEKGTIYLDSGLASANLCINLDGTDNTPDIKIMQDSDIMFCEVGGRVGIGADPDYNLHVESANGNPTIFLKSVSSSYVPTYIIDADRATGGSSYGSMQFRNKGNILSTINCQTGTTTNDSTMAFFTSDTLGLEIDQDQSVFVPQVYSDSASDGDVYIDSDGQLGINISTREAKTNILDVTQADINKLLDLRVCEFRYRDSPDVKRIGVIAEEADTVGIPGFVGYKRVEITPKSKRGKRQFAIDHTKPAHVNPSKLIPLLVAKVQQHEREISVLKQQLLHFVTAYGERLYTLESYPGNYPPPVDPNDPDPATGRPR